MHQVVLSMLAARVVSPVNKLCKVYSNNNRLKQQVPSLPTSKMSRAKVPQVAPITTSGKIA